MLQHNSYSVKITVTTLLEDHGTDATYNINQLSNCSSQPKPPLLSEDTLSVLRWKSRFLSVLYSSPETMMRRILPTISTKAKVVPVVHWHWVSSYEAGWGEPNEIKVM